MHIDGAEYLFYRAFPIHVGIIRATTGDADGNLTMEKEALTLEALAIAMAAHNSGGIVIAQVERVADNGSLNPRQVKIPGVLVDCVVVAKPENHWQTFATEYNPAYSGEIRVRAGSLPPMPMCERKIIARRAALELKPNGVVNLGIGMPEGISAVGNEEKIIDLITLTAEPGVIGGVPASGMNFGAAINTAGGDRPALSIRLLRRRRPRRGLSRPRPGRPARQSQCQQVRPAPRRGRRLHQHQPERQERGLRRHLHGGRAAKSRWATAGSTSSRKAQARKFVSEVEHRTFSGEFAAARGQPALYVTERCVFSLSAEGLELIEIAPGVDIEARHSRPDGFQAASSAANPS